MLSRRDTSLRTAERSGRLLLGEDQVERSLRVAQHLARLLDLRRVARANDLGRRDRDVLDGHRGLAGLVVHVAAERLPRGAELRALLLYVGTALVGELEDPATLALGGAHEA